MLMALTPVIVLLYSILFIRESTSKLKILGILLSIAGAVMAIVLSGNGGSSGTDNLLGVTYSILCVVFYSAYLILTRNISIKYRAITVAKWMFLFSTLFALPFASELPNQNIYSEVASLHAFMLLGFSLLFSTTLAFFLMPVALKKLTASIVSTFMNLQPVVASVVAIAVGQNILTWDKPIAMLLVISGVYLVTNN